MLEVLGNSFSEIPSLSAPICHQENTQETYTNDVLGFGSNVKSGKAIGSNVEVSQISTSSSEELMVRSKPLIALIPALKALQTTPASDHQSPPLDCQMDQKTYPAGAWREQSEGRTVVAPIVDTAYSPRLTVSQARLLVKERQNGVP